MLDNWTRYVVKHRTFVFFIWLVLILLGVICGTKLNSHLTTSLSVPNTASAQADSVLVSKFNENVEGTFTVIYQFKNATSKAINEFESQIASASKSIPTSSIAEEKALGGTLFVNVNTALSLSRASAYTDEFRSSLRRAGLSGALVTGPPAIKSDVTPILAGDLHRGELIGILVALLILLLLFGFSLEIFVPLLAALATISATIGAIFLIAERFLVVLYIPNIVELIGLGFALDYSLLILVRYGSEAQQAPEDRTDAIVRTMAKAGRTVGLSALTVALALATLTLVPIPFIRSLGVAAALVPLISLGVAFTLQPALLSLPIFTAHRQPTGVAFFSRVGRLTVKRPWLVAVGSLTVLLALGLQTLALHITPSSLTAVPSQLESQRALTLVTSTIGAGVVTPNEVIIDLGASESASNQEIVQARQALASHILKDPEVLAVASGKKPPYVDAAGRYLRLFVFARHSFGASQSQALVKKLRAISLTEYGFPTSATFFVAGAAAQGADLLRVLTHAFPWIILLSLVATLLLLTSAFKSLILPIKAIALDLISLCVAYGVVVATFGNSLIARTLGIYHLNQIEAWALLFLFVLLFGVSMDYEVFIISRIKEAKERGLSNVESIIEGVSETGIVVTAGAVIFMGAVTGLALGHFAGLQEIGIGLIFGVLIDATLIRMLLLPSAMVLLGRWNWWLPTSLARLIKTSPTPLHEERG